MSDHSLRTSVSALSRLTGLVLCCAGLAHSQTQAGVQQPLTERERALLDRIESLEKRVAALEGKAPVAAQAPRSSVLGSAATGAAAATTAAAANVQSPDATKRGILGLPGTTLNFYFDGYYGWNFNRPVGGVNLLRANDVLSNNLSLNQISLILERQPDVAAGRRYGGRVDLMFGQNTETMQGGTQNEPRPQVYRNIFQAYGTYVFPVGKGLTVDFGKFYSALGFENNYAYDEINYSRSFYFDFLPFYHMGLRTTYSFNDKLTVQHWLVNGANQTEDFNSYKSNAFLFTIKPTQTVSWNVNYYFGSENRTLVPDYNPGIPILPTQPGLSVIPLPGPKANGREHIFDTYASWSPTGKVTLAGEFDYVVSRLISNSPPSHVIGGVGYLQYHFTPKFTLAGRFEYLQDHHGLFSFASQDLKEHTITATYQLIEGFQTRLEYRRDFSNRPFFLTETPGILKKEQNTATLGLIWWFGGKREPW
jgi:Putative beta-barrel porin-2, OmpL-like. bbp2